MKSVIADDDRKSLNDKKDTIRIRIRKVKSIHASKS